MWLYHERQEAGLCAVHAMNSLLQGPSVTVEELAAAAHVIDEDERQLMASAGTESESYLRWMARDSSNIADDGNFSMQVIQRSLSVRGVDCAPVTAFSPPVSASDDVAFIANLESHWLTLRKVKRWWFNLNSLLREPKYLSDFYLSLYVSELQRQGYSVFRIGGALPETKDDFEPPHMSSSFGRWLMLIDSGAGQPPEIIDTAPPSPKEEREEKALAVDEEEEHEKEAVEKPKGRPATDRKRELADRSEADDDLALALALSLSEASSTKRRQ